MPAMNPQVSIIVPTYNESQNILGMLRSIRESIPAGVSTETIIVDDNSPDGTGKIVEDYILGLKKMASDTINVIHRTAKSGLSSAILNGIQKARGDTIVVMDSDFSHPPQTIPKLIDALRQCELAIASRYIAGGRINGWPAKRRVLSRIATVIAKKGLGIGTRDPMSGFFAFKKSIIDGLSFDALGYKLLLEILVKAEGIRIKEIPYTFEERRSGSSKLDGGIMVDYIRSVWKLYRYGKKKADGERRASVRFFSKAARFFTVGASGFVVNYAVSLMFTSWYADFWYIHANIFGIMASISSNFVLNKVWTFEDRDFEVRRTMSQFGKFSAFSSIGAVVQIGMVFWLVDSHGFGQPLALFLAIATAAFSNYVLNKRLTFKEKLWD